MTDQTPGAKGRPTPSRKEAEAARKKAMKTPMTRKEQARRQREVRAQLRERQQAALRGDGDQTALPVRDRGPVKAFVRDVVDRRFNVAEFLLPVLLVVLLLSFVNTTWAVAITLYTWMIMILGTVVDEIVLVRKVKRLLRERFPDVPTKGTTSYAVLRSSQLRRFRLPKPQIERGGELRQRY